MEIIAMFSKKDMIATHYLHDMYSRLKLIDREINNQIEKGIQLHDNGKYDEALKIYDEILKVYPNSAFALYEKYFTQNTLNIKNKKYQTDDFSLWQSSKKEIYKHNPLYGMDVTAKGAKEMYKLQRRLSINGLFKKENNILENVVAYADIAMDLEVYDFAAQLYWFTFTHHEKDQNKSLYKFLYCLEKLGVTEIKNNFKGDFKSIFKKIEEDLEAAPNTNESKK